MSFKPFILSMIGLALIGISVGYLLGYYVHKYTLNEYLFYIPVIIMGVGCVLVIYATLFVNVEK